MILWFFIEIINFLFICTLNLSINKKKLIFFYFLIQILPSFLIIFRIIINNIIFYYNFTNFFIIISLLIKLRLPPFHYWLPLISISIPWYSFFLLLSIQKLIPFYILSLIHINLTFIHIILIICAFIPPFMIIKTNNFKVLISYSSINQSRWIIILIYIKNIIWFRYFIIYSIILLCIFTIIYINKISKSLIYFFTPKFNILNIIYIINLARMPPFSFFIIKWYRIFFIIINTNLYIIIILIIISSLIILYLYTLILIKAIFFHSLNSKIIKFNQYKIFFNKIIIIFLFNLFISLIIIII